jgi:hypothetical protein
VECDRGETTLIDDRVVAGIVGSRGIGHSKKREHGKKSEVRM